jgi:hypothetical protein
MGEGVFREMVEGVDVCFECVVPLFSETSIVN